MTEIQQPFETLKRLGSQPTLGVYLRLPASADAIQQMQRDAREIWGEPIPEEYEILLRISDGVQIEGAYFKQAANLVPENQDVFDPQIVVLGNSGNVEWYVFDRQDRQFHITTMGCPNERFGSFQSFAELLTAVFSQQQVT
jgi:hypothetical protein